MRLKRLFVNEFKILFVLLIILLSISLFAQYSAANGHLDQVQRHFIRVITGVIIMYSVYIVDFRVWINSSYMFYILIIMLLVIVNFLGTIKLGAQRWVDLYFFSFQPSELMKISLILALSRYYSTLSYYEIKELKNHISPILLIALPSILIFKQPDFGTASLLLCTGLGIVFLSGFPWKTFGIAIISSVVLCPVGWFFLHDYQKNRILIFLDPDRDQLGIGYHILQSKIAIGSGHILGRGFLKGSQTKLNFLPEKNTDFIFTTIAEEFGFIGSLLVIFLFSSTVLYFFWVASVSKIKFAKFMCYGLGILMFLHVFVNIAMVIGIVPVVGIPLPFMSYGGSSMITFMISCGLVMSALGKRKAR